MSVLDIVPMPEDQAAYAAGRQDALDEIAVRGRTVHAHVERPWRAVPAGSSMVAPNGSLWHVWSVVRQWDGRYTITVLCGGQQSTRPNVDPDEHVTVLVPMPEHVAVSTLREAFGSMTHVAMPDGQHPAVLTGAVS
jgi:hypothetical protein